MREKRKRKGKTKQGMNKRREKKRKDNSKQNGTQFDLKRNKRKKVPFGNKGGTSVAKCRIIETEEDQKENE